MLVVVCLLGLGLECVLDVSLVHFGPQWCQVRVIADGDWQTHGHQHSVFFGLLDLALLLGDACSFGCF